MSPKESAACRRPCCSSDSLREVGFRPSAPEWIEEMRGVFEDFTPTPVEVAQMGNAPSYRFKVEETRRLWRWLRESIGMADPLMDINDKRQAYIFADQLGVDHPRLYGVYDTIGQVDWRSLPPEFVLKSRFGSSNRGVKALVRQEDGTFLDLLRSRAWTIEEILADQAQLEARGKASPEMFAEELIRKPHRPAEIVDDWKFYCFDGVVGISMQRDLCGSPNTSDWRFCFRDRDWNDLGPIKFSDRHSTDLELPVDAQRMLEVAEAVSAAIGRPFLRIDLFESDRGPLLGEFTPMPGPPEIFTPEMDVYLGQMWERAQVRAFAREVRDGRWDHLRIDAVQVGVDGRSSGSRTPAGGDRLRPPFLNWLAGRVEGVRVLDLLSHGPYAALDLVVEGFEVTAVADQGALDSLRQALSSNPAVETSRLTMVDSTEDPLPTHEPFDSVFAGAAFSAAAVPARLVSRIAASLEAEGLLLLSIPLVPEPRHDSGAVVTFEDLASLIERDFGIVGGEVVGEWAVLAARKGKKHLKGVMRDLRSAISRFAADVGRQLDSERRRRRRAETSAMQLRASSMRPSIPPATGEDDRGVESSPGNLAVTTGGSDGQSSGPVSAPGASDWCDEDEARLTAHGGHA